MSSREVGRHVGVQLYELKSDTLAYESRLFGVFSRINVIRIHERMPYNKGYFSSWPLRRHNPSAEDTKDDREGPRI